MTVFLVVNCGLIKTYSREYIIRIGTPDICYYSEKMCYGKRNGL